MPRNLKKFYVHEFGFCTHEVGPWLVTKRIESLVEREIVAATARHGFAALSERKTLGSFFYFSLQNFSQRCFSSTVSYRFGFTLMVSKFQCQTKALDEYVVNLFCLKCKMKYVTEIQPSGLTMPSRIQLCLVHSVITHIV